MNNAAKSILYFSYYLLFMGVCLVLIPNVLLPMLGFPHATDGWIRFLGIVTLVLGFYYHQTSVNGITSFFRFTVTARIFVMVASIGLVVFGKMPWQLILVGMVDFVGAIWTHKSLKLQEQSKP